MNMITINKTLPDGKLKPIPHKENNPERVGKIMTKKELHKFGLGLLIAYLNIQKGELIKANFNIGNDYPHLIAKNPKGQLLYIWVKTEMYPKMPSIMSIENHEEVITLSNQFNATPVFAGMKLTCVSTEEMSIPVYRAGYVAEFRGFKAFLPEPLTRI
jgi:hypothetical protein